MAHYFENDTDLKSEIKKTSIRVLDREYTFYTDNGVFAKKGLDYATHLLIDTVGVRKLKGRILDLGCGYGPIGIIIKKEASSSVVDMVDVNNRALGLAKKNALANDVDVNIFNSDGYREINKKYNYIISNPPIRVGKKKLYELLFNARNYLLPGGELWIVVHKDQGAKSVVRDLKEIYEVEVVNKDKGFFIIKAVI